MDKQLMDWADKGPIKQYRNDKNLSQLEAALIFGVSALTIQKWERGVTVPNEENMLKLGEVIGNAAPGRMGKWRKLMPRA